MTPGARWRAVCTTFGLCGVVLSAPLLKDSEGAFPLSRYPMFATARPRIEALPFVVAVLDDQLRDPLSGNAVLGGVAITMQAVAQEA